MYLCSQPRHGTILPQRIMISDGGGAMVTVKEWRINLDKDGTPCLIILNEKYQNHDILRLDSEDITFEPWSISFWREDRNDKVEKYECDYNHLSRGQKPTPIDQLLQMGTITEKKRHSLVFLYEFLSGVMLRTNPVITDKSWDLEALLDKYSYLGEQIHGVEFDRIADFLYRKFTCKGVNRSGRYFFE